jgi:hypothetical protein
MTLIATLGGCLLALVLGFLIFRFLDVTEELGRVRSDVRRTDQATRDRLRAER